MDIIKNRKLKYIIITLLSVSCIYWIFGSEDKIYNLIDNKWNASLNKDSCRIDLSTEISFKWDYFVYARSGCDYENLTKLIKIEYFDYEEFCSKIFFVYQNRIVYKKYWDNIPDEKQFGITFDVENSVVKIYKSNSKFIIRKYNEVYILTPVN